MRRKTEEVGSRLSNKRGKLLIAAFPIYGLMVDAGLFHAALIGAAIGIIYRSNGPETFSDGLFPRATSKKPGTVDTAPRSDLTFPGMLVKVWSR